MGSRAAILVLTGLVPLFATLGILAADELEILTDREPLEYAASDYDKEVFRTLSDFRVELGIHGITTVVAEFICSDICPAHTVRVIHYDIPWGSSCFDIGGVEEVIRVPAGTGTMARPFCIPRLLIETGYDYVK